MGPRYRESRDRFQQFDIKPMGMMLNTGAFKGDLRKYPKIEKIPLGPKG